MSNRVYRTSLFVFRRDLRLEDNLGLLGALQQSQRVVPVFVFDPRQIDRSLNTHFSENAFQFMSESLEELDKTLKNRGTRLYVGYGEAAAVLDRLLASGRFDAVHCNQDYTPFAAARDSAIKTVCGKHNVAYCGAHDALLTQPEAVRTGDGSPYKVFAAFKRKARDIAEVPVPRANKFSNWYKGTIEGLNGISLVHELMPAKKRRRLAQQGGRGKAIERMRAFEFSRYGDERDRPDLDGTSRLSAHLKFGTISVRELYWRVVASIGQDQGEAYISELYWRDFYAHLLYWYPYLLGTAMQEKYRTKTGGSKLKWSRSKQDFKRWCQGQTGFPIVDAGMRQLAETGWMHNRVRMIAGSFLVKDLHIDWRWGEKHFAQHLVDYDPASNNGGWQWVASTGADAQPYFRIFNPWNQQRKFDPDCQYVKRFVPEVRDLYPDQIHAIEKHGVPAGIAYPQAMVDHKVERQVALEHYKKL